MRRMAIVLAAILAALLPFIPRAAFAQKSAGAAPRNIVLILVDDLRYDTLGFVNPYFTTPNIDALARGGVYFKNSFVTTSLCSPSRASILTGLYAHSHGVLDNDTPLPASTPIFPQELQKAGYDTGFIGKWHMGGWSDKAPPGINRWVSFAGQGVYKNPPLSVDGQKIQSQGYVTDLLTQYAVDFIKSPHKGPFFLFLSHKGVHAPLAPADRHKGSYAGKVYPLSASMANTDQNYAGKPDWIRRARKSWNGVDVMYDGSVKLDKFIQNYAEVLRSVDDSVGRVVDALKEEGKLSSTLILFTSDNGFLFGEHGLIDKRTMHEPSMRVPMIAYCPELIRGGTARDEMVLNIDVAPTILEAAGKKPAGPMHGQSFYKRLTGADDTSKDFRPAFIYEYFWDRSYPQTPSVLGVRTPKHSYMQYQGIWDKYELYDVEKDPAQMNNLLGGFQVGVEGNALDVQITHGPDKELKALFKDLNNKMDGMLARSGGSMEPNWRSTREKSGGKKAAEQQADQ